ncbi:PspC domain-containing protein [Abyssicoccus albus]|uniref:Phage shock protein C (PspC) family protein n=1 Tax=Abyssicoccus albus TaxID=1817405 RepID=A0A3N5BQW7_9BACL|nr:PspC domain-containing protein [Abyssicoccus albus]RPF57400.1 phage shock protein C (PspC) family protein [Abyssicoccus albus]
MTKKLTRSTTDSMIAGVCGGIAEYFDWDVSIVRIATVVLALLTTNFPLIIVYIIVAVILPKDTDIIE